jgi:hypothetical protein
VVRDIKNVFKILRLDSHFHENDNINYLLLSNLLETSSQLITLKNELI